MRRRERERKSCCTTTQRPIILRNRRIQRERERDVRGPLCPLTPTRSEKFSENTPPPPPTLPARRGNSAFPRSFDFVSRNERINYVTNEASARNSPPPSCPSTTVATALTRNFVLQESLFHILFKRGGGGVALCPLFSVTATTTEFLEMCNCVISGGKSCCFIIYFPGQEGEGGLSF